MAEDIVSFVLNKLLDADFKKVLQIHGIGEQAETLSHELCWTQFFLKDAHMMQWVEDVSDVASGIEYVIENAILLKVDGNLSKELPRGCSQIVKATKMMWSKWKNRVALHKLADDMNEILARTQEINKSRKSDGIVFLGEGTGERLRRQPVMPFVLPDIDDPYIVGFDYDKDNIVNQLLDTRTKRCVVISVVGPEGLGKTTLARKVYNSNYIKRQFDIRIWVTIPQEFNLMNILRKIIEQVQPLTPYDLQGGEGYLLGKLYKILNGEKYPQRILPKKYLLVLDDLWTNDLWTRISSMLPDAEIGSRVVITTRIPNIPNNAEQYKLPYLTEKPNLELLFKTALPNRDSTKAYPDDLYEVGRQFVKKCGGLPLALVVLGGLLSKMTANYDAWSKMFQTMNWDIDGRECIEVALMSYNDLPIYLKSCFMYFAVFPEDHEINAQRLFRLWIAKGFVPKEEARTLEDTAEIFLEELVQRSLVQVSERSHANSITSCRIHGLLRVELAIQKAKEDNFLIICSNPDNRKSIAKARRVAVHYSEFSQLMEHTNSNLRSLLCFEKSLPNCSRQRLLKVLSAMGQSRLVEFECFHGLTWLSYCELSGISISSKRSFELFISSLKFVETLDFRLLTDHYDLPDDIWNVKTLRHVMLSVMEYHSGPTSFADLKNLQTLTVVTSRESWDAQLPNLPNVRNLDMEVSWYSWDLIATFLGTLNDLTCLKLVGYGVPQEIIKMQKFPFYLHLQSLSLGEQSRFCCNMLSLEVGMFPIHVTELTLMNLQFQGDPLPLLEKLCNLRVIRLIGERENRKMSCSAGGFLQLRELTFNHLTNLTEWKIEAGAMPIIKLVTIEDCDNLEVPLGLEYLSNLEELKVIGCQLLQIQSNEIWDLCKHVPNISFRVLRSLECIPLI